MNKEQLNDIQYERKRTYELKSKTKDESIKEECNSKVDFYNAIIKDLQIKVKTCKIIEDNHKMAEKELSKDKLETTKQKERIIC